MQYSAPDIQASLWEKRKDNLSRIWYKFSGNYLSVVGLAIVLLVIFLAIFAPWVTPYPEHKGAFVDFSNSMQSPSVEHWFGTDAVGRDIFTRVIFGFRFSLMMGFVVIGLAAPPGIVAGLVAGYFRDTWIDTVIMRVTDVFLAVPPLILAMAITAVLPPNVFYAMLAVTLMWWPWYARLVYGIASSLQNEFFVQAAQVTGASKSYIIFREILPNSISAIFTKMTLDVGIVIIIAASLSFVGLGAQPPTPDLGTMVSDGAKYLPDQWWLTICPALAIVFVVLGFNLLGDGLRDMLAVEEV
ncbi:MAG: ABC transporter permease [Dethiobacteria bacterium]|nr:ABC transporter permease [Dethiobacteria bacterium]